MKISGEETITSKKGDAPVWTRSRKWIVEQMVSRFGGQKTIPVQIL